MLSILFQKRKRSKELILGQERAYPRLYWSLRTALRPLIDAHEQQIDLDLVSPVVNTPGSSSSGSSGCCSLAVGSGGNGQGGASGQQKRQQRRAKANSMSSVGPIVQWQAGEQDENEDETDEEPVL